MCMTRDSISLEMLKDFIGKEVIVKSDPEYGNSGITLKGIIKRYISFSPKNPEKITAIELSGHSDERRIIVRCSAICTIGVIGL